MVSNQEDFTAAIDHINATAVYGSVAYRNLVIHFSENLPVSNV